MPAPSEAHSGEEARRWFEKPALSTLDRMPLLADVMADVARAWATSFCALSATAGSVVFKGLERSRVATVALKRRKPLLALLDVPEWQTVLGVQFDRAFLGMVVDAVFGGDGEDGGHADLGAATAIEIRMADVLARQVADALSVGFRPVLPATFTVTDLQGSPEWATLGKPTAEMVVVTCELAALGRTASVDLVFPKTALEPLAEHLVEKRAGPTATPDTGWSRILKAEVGRAEVDLRACIDVQPLTLGAIARLRPGDTIALPSAATSNVHLRCENGTLFRCELGQSAGFYTVRIDGETGPQAGGARPGEPLQAWTAEQR